MLPLAVLFGEMERERGRERERERAHICREVKWSFWCIYVCACVRVFKNNKSQHIMIVDACLLSTTGTETGTKCRQIP